MKKLFFSLAVLLGLIVNVETNAQDLVPTTVQNLKYEVIEMSEIGVKIIWDAGNEKLVILGTTQSENMKLSLDGETSKPKEGKGFRVLYETTFLAALPLHQYMQSKLAEDELNENSKDWEQAYIGDVVSSVDVTLFAKQDRKDDYTWVMANVSASSGEIWLEVYKLDCDGELVLFSKSWLRQ